MSHFQSHSALAFINGMYEKDVELTNGSTQKIHPTVKSGVYVYLIDLPPLALKSLYESVNLSDQCMLRTQTTL